MILDLKKAFITDGYSSQIEYELDLSDIDFSGVFPLKKPISISGEVSNKAGVVLLSIHCKACYEAPCDRCGEFCEENIAVDNEYILATEIENEENDDIILVSDMKLNLAELCRTDVLLHIPMKHLCRKDCKGVCAGCGTNLNKDTCKCVHDKVDPRLAALADLLK